MTHLTVGLYTLVMELFHAVIGVIVSVYILFGKETFINQSKKATYAICSDRTCQPVDSYCSKDK